MWAGLALGALVGVALGAGGTYLVWGRRAEGLRVRLASLESTAAQVEDERERLRRELADIVHERKEMAAAAERLRTQVEEQLRRLEALSAELAPQAGGAERPPDAPP